MIENDLVFKIFDLFLELISQCGETIGKNATWSKLGNKLSKVFREPKYSKMVNQQKMVQKNYLKVFLETILPGKLARAPVFLRAKFLE